MVLHLLQTRALTKEQKKNSDLNIREIKERKTILESYPRRLLLELTNACNLRCIMCGRSAINFKETFFDMSYLKKLEDALNISEEVTLFGWGEPTVHPDFINFLKYMHNYPIKKYFVTNGMRLDKLKDILFDYKVDIMSISLDGGCAETNNRIRKGSDFKKIINDISEIVQEKRKRKINYPYMRFVFTAMQSNYKEIPDLLRVAYEIGLEEIKVLHFTTFKPEILHESLWNYQKEVKKVFEASKKTAESLGIKVSLPPIQGEDPAGDKLHRNCYTSWRDFFLGSDNYIRPCQSTSRQLFHIDKYFSFKEMWNSKELQDFRATVNNPSLMPPGCRSCYQASHANWNNKYSFIQVNNKFAPDWKEENKK